MLGFLLAMDALLLLVAIAGSKRGGCGIEACEGSDGDLITEALTDEATEECPSCSGRKVMFFYNIDIDIYITQVPLTS